MRTRSLLAPALPILAAFALAGCGTAENDPGPGGVTAGEAAELNAAAAMLDVNAVSADAVSNTEE